MNTISRLNLLFLSLHMPPVFPKALQLTYNRTLTEHGEYGSYKSVTPVHDLIDRIDRQVGIITRYKLGGSLAPVGERLRRLERHIQAREQPPYFWLGAQAENLALTG